MVATLLAIGLFTIHVSPYFLIEQSVIEHNSSDTIFYEYPNFNEEEYDSGYVISQLGDVIALGVTLGEKHLWTSFSLGIPTYGYSIKFLPFFDVPAKTLHVLSNIFGFFFKRYKDPAFIRLLDTLCKKLCGKNSFCAPRGA